MQRLGWTLRSALFFLWMVVTVIPWATFVVLMSIVVRGTRMVKPAQPAPFLAALKPITERVERDPLATEIKTYGSSYYVDLADAAGGLTGRNGQDSAPLGPLLRDGFADYGPVVEHGCPRCPLPCYHDYDLPDQPNQLIPRPEIESIAGFGARCGLTSIDAIVEASARCLRYGLDPTATANAIAGDAELRGGRETRGVPERRLGALRERRVGTAERRGARAGRPRADRSRSRASRRRVPALDGRRRGCARRARACRTA